MIIPGPDHTGVKSKAVVSAIRSSSRQCFNVLPLPKWCCFSVRPLTDRCLVEQLAVCGTCVFPLVWRASDHNMIVLYISRSRTLHQKIWTGIGL